MTGRLLHILVLSLALSGCAVATRDGSRSSENPVNAMEVTLHDHITRVTDTGGDGEPFVLVHALGTDQHMWDDVIPVLAKNRRVISYDVRGHGRAAGAPTPFSMEIFARDLATLLDNLKVKRAHIAGLSMGGVIAQTFALDYPDRVASLSLIATASKPQDSFLNRGRSGRIDGMAAQLGPTLTRWFTPDMLALNASGVQYARKSLLQNSADAWEASWHAMAGMQVYERLGDISVPTKVIAGELDVSCPPTLMSADIASRIRGSTMHVIAGASHMVSLTKPTELAQLVLK